MPRTITAFRREPTEWTVDSAAGDPFTSTEVDVEIAGPGGTFRVPAFWSGGGEWRVRFAAPEDGDYRWWAYATGAGVTSDTTKPGPTAAGVAPGATGTEATEPAWNCTDEGVLRVLPHESDNPLYRHGALSVDDQARGFRHADGTPFVWYGDTWWMGFTKRLPWPDGFAELTADRVGKGFTVVQIVAGLYPDMPWADPRGENEAGLPYDDSLDRPNTAWWDMADLKVRHLVRAGIVPCIVGAWGYYSTVFGVERLKRHWRHIVARWGAYPVVWCLAGEGAMPYYLSETPRQDAERQRSDWTEIARYVRSIDPMRRLVTIHPTDSGREQVTDDTVLDFDMLQTGHDGRVAIGNTVRLVGESLAKRPKMPVVVGEVIYEGILHESDAEKLRLVWWASVLSGAGGFTYGANGIWQFNQEGKPYGPSPHGATWGNTPWREAADLPGATHLGHSARFLARFDWPRLEPHPEWVEPALQPDEFAKWYSAGVLRSYRLIYFYAPIVPWATADSPRIVGLETDLSWRATWFDPRIGTETEIGPIEPDAEGCWPVPVMPEMKDYVLAIRR